MQLSNLIYRMVLIECPHHFFIHEKVLLFVTDVTVMKQLVMKPFFLGTFKLACFLPLGDLKS